MRIPGDLVFAMLLIFGAIGWLLGQLFGLDVLMTVIGCIVGLAIGIPLQIRQWNREDDQKYAKWRRLLGR